MIKSSVNTKTTENIDLKPIFEMAVKYVERIGCVDETTISKIAANTAFKLANTDVMKNYIEDIKHWPDCIGGGITTGSVEAFRILAEKIKSVSHEPPMNKSFKDINIEEIQNINLKRDIANLKVCFKNENKTLLTANEISYSYSRKTFNEVIFEKNDDRSLELKKYAEKIDISGKIKVALSVWALNKQLESLDDPKDILVQFANRLTEYIKKYDIDWETFEKLPVLHKPETECIVSSTRDEKVSDTFWVKTKVNMVNAPKKGALSPNKPSKVCEKAINGKDCNPDNLSGRRVNILEELYKLMNYIDTGKYDDDIRNMESYKIKTDYDRLGELIDELPWITVKETAYIVLDESVDPDSKSKDSFRISFEETDGVPIEFCMNSVNYGFSNTLFPGKDSYVEHIDVPCRHTIIYHNNLSKSGISTDLPKYRNSNAPIHFTSVQNIIYDITFAATMLAWYGNMEGYIFNNRFTQNGKDGFEFTDRHGSDKFITATGYAMEQLLSAEKLHFYTQGITEANIRNSFAKRNAASSLISNIPYTIHIPSRKKIANGVGIIYITAKVTDKQSFKDKSALRMVCTQGYKISDDRIEGIRNTTEILPSDNAYNFSEMRAFIEVLKQMEKDKMETILVVMDAPFSCSTAKETNIKGLDKDNIEFIEKYLHVPLIIPVFSSTISAKYKKLDDYKSTGIINMHREVSDDSSIVPLFAFFAGWKPDGYKENGNRSGTMYTTRRNYYSGKTGKFIEEYMKMEKPDAIINIQRKIFYALYLLHMVTNEKSNVKADEGKVSIFDRLKNSIVSHSEVTYQMEPNSDSFKRINYLALEAKLYDGMRLKNE